MKLYVNDSWLVSQLFGNANCPFEIGNINVYRVYYIIDLLNNPKITNFLLMLS